MGHDSELGGIATNHLKSEGWQVIGTSRRQNNSISDGVFHCDLGNRNSITSACSDVLGDGVGFDLVILSIGQLSPVGRISEIDFEAWNSSFDVNFVNQVFFIREIIKNLSSLGYSGTKFLSFAGSGTNSAPVNFSAYTLSKIALIKSMELFSVEFPNYYFLSLGTGWMKSAIHNQTLDAGPIAGESYFETVRRISEDDFGSPSLFSDFLDWYISLSDTQISGRNVALQGDDWKEPEFIPRLKATSNSYKLRRVTE